MTLKMEVFRIDNREYLIGDCIKPQNEYQNKLKGDKLKVEEILEKWRPENKPSRNSIVMVFETFESAKSHWTIQSNSKFYKAKITNEQILHRGDFNKVEELFKNINEPNNVENIAIEYWNGIMTENPKVEIFVNSIVLNEILSASENERKNAYRIRAGLEPIKNIRIITNEN